MSQRLETARGYIDAARLCLKRAEAALSIEEMADYSRLATHFIRLAEAEQRLAAAAGAHPDGEQ